MAEPIRAEDVLVECWMEVGEIGKEEVRALLAHGSEHGVVILPDGTLRGLADGRPDLIGPSVVGEGHVRMTDVTEPVEPISDEEWLAEVEVMWRNGIEIGGASLARLLALIETLRARLDAAEAKVERLRAMEALRMAADAAMAALDTDLGEPT